MKISTVTALSPTGRTWEGPNGLMYFFNIELEDGTRGEVGALREDGPAYGIGEKVEYTATTNAHGTRLKCKKHSEEAGRRGFQAGFKKSAEADRSVGMRVGMCINNACQFHIHAEGGAHYDLNGIKKMALELYQAALAMEAHVQKEEQ